MLLQEAVRTAQRYLPCIGTVRLQSHRVLLLANGLRSRRLCLIGCYDHGYDNMLELQRTYDSVHHGKGAARQPTSKQGVCNSNF